MWTSRCRSGTPGSPSTASSSAAGSSPSATYGHAALLTLIEYARPGGLILVSTRGSYATETGFEKFALSPEVAALATLRFTMPDAGYIAEEGADYWVFRKNTTTS